MIHNQIHQILTEISAEQGWNESSQIQHLCEFICWVRRNWLHEMESHELEERFRAYLQNRVDDENQMAEICEGDQDESKE